MSYARGVEGYEEARRGSVRNARVPERYPDVIVQANDVHDVVDAMRRANREGLRVTVRSGGHSWAASHLRDGGLLLDVSRLDDARVDAPRRRATAGPGVTGYDLAVELKRDGLFFPAGHCRGVCLGGYLLQGGFGWHSRVFGPACMSVDGVDVVTAEGEVVHASAEENADLYWAARGSGPGFFGVVTRFHLRLYRRPRVIGFSAHSYPLGMVEEVFHWLHQIGPSVPASIELQALMTRRAEGAGGPGIVVVAPVFADGVRDALRDVSFMHDSPLRRRAARSLRFVPSGLRFLYRGVMTHYPEDHRYAVDNMWTSARFDDLLPGLRRIAETLPPAPSHMLWMNWAPPPNRPDMAYSVEDDIYIALYAVWKRAEDDARYARWPAERLAAMEKLSSGCQLADENLGERPQRFVTEANLARLDRLRRTYDPAGRFQPWMGRP